MKIETIDDLKRSKYFEIAETPEGEKKVEESFDEKIEHVSGPIVSILGKVVILYRMLKDGTFKISSEVKMMIIAALVYFISPVDLIPDFIPIIGYIDDATVLGLVIKFLSNDITRFEHYISRKEAVC